MATSHCALLTASRTQLDGWAVPHGVRGSALRAWVFIARSDLCLTIGSML